MKMMTFAKRNFKELVRDPISLIFCIGLPLFLLIIFQQFKIPSSVYSIENFAPSIIIFSFGFLSLFSGQLIARDRTTSLLTRLFVSPLSISDYIIGYIVALLPLAIIQCTLFILVASFYGMNLTIYSLLTILLMIPVAILFISLGLLIGFSCNDKQAPGVASIIIQLIAFTSGMWFDISIVSGLFKLICNVLPFRYAVDLSRSIMSCSMGDILIPLLIILGYTILVLFVSSLIFKKKMKSDVK